MGLLQLHCITTLDMHNIHIHLRLEPAVTAPIGVLPCRPKEEEKTVRSLGHWCTANYNTRQEDY